MMKNTIRRRLLTTKADHMIINLQIETSLNNIEKEMKGQKHPQREKINKPLPEN